MKPFGLVSIRARLLALIGCTVLLAQVVVAGLSLWQEATRYASQKSETLIATARVLAAASGPALAEHDRSGVYNAIRAAGHIPGVGYVGVRTPDGRLLADVGATEQLVGDLAIDPGSPTLPVGALLASRTVEVHVPVIQSGSEVGALDLVADTSDLPERLLSSVGTIAIGGVSGLALALLLALQLQRGITGPLRRLTSTMRRVKESHDYAVAMPPAGADEVGVLVDGFNTMISDIRERDRRLVEHLEQLEHEVADRTKDFQAAAAEAQSANQAKSDFLATMSHEIRTPMNGILVMAELLAGCELPARARRHADVIAKSGQSLLAIINDILDLSKIEAGRLEVETLDVEPAEAGETVLRLFAERARSSGLDLCARVSLPRGALVVADPVRLGQVLSNLVNNALKFTQKGGVTLEIAADPDDAARARFSIVDSGIGIPADKLETIFDAFAQADQTTTRRFGGTGLGLAIGRKLVAAMGGELRVASEAGRGSTFYFSIPLSARSAARIPARLSGRALVCLPGAGTASSAALYLGDMGYLATPVDESDVLAAAAGAHALMTSPEFIRAHGRPRMTPDGVVLVLADPGEPADDLVERGLADMVLQYPLSRAEVDEVGAWLLAGRPRRDDVRAARLDDMPDFSGARVLVADDSDVNLEVARAALARLGVAPVTVENGREALAAIEAAEFDIVFMDGSMPEMDGFEAARAIRALEQRTGRRRTPVIALTAHVVGAAAEEWRSADMDGVLHKPYTLARLSECLAAHVQRSGVGFVQEAPAQTAPQLLDPAALDGLREMSADGSLVARVARLYCANAPARIADLRDAIAHADATGAAAAAHALKSMSLNIGAQAVAETAGDIERSARETGAPGDAAAVDQLTALAERTYALLLRRAA